MVTRTATTDIITETGPRPVPVLHEPAERYFPTS
jgi:hypothetical protein